MKQAILGLGALTIVLIIGYFIANTTNGKSFITQAEAETYSILLYPKTGEVLYKLPSASEFAIATESPTKLENNTIVKTATGTAVVLLPDNSSISLEPQTEITVTSQDNKTSILQTLGSTYHRVEALVSGGSYEVRTPGTLAAVRGTKFAVKYDNVAKKTKIAVTEHQVAVKQTEKEQTQSTSTVDEIMVKEGKTINVEESKDPKFPKGRMVVMETIKDVEMKNYIDKQREEDKKLEEIKDKMKKMMEEEEKKETEQVSDKNDDSAVKEREQKMKKREKELTRKEMKKVLFNDLKEEKEDSRNDDGVDDVKKEETKEVTKQDDSNREAPNTTETKPVTTTVIKTVETETEREVEQEQPKVITKMSEEAFFSTFEPLFFKHFYLDDADTPCTTVKGKERVAMVKNYAQTNGYPFTRDLLSFSEALDTYCVSKDKTLKTRLQARFDEEYPFQD